MAASASAFSGDDDAVMSDINVTPLVDVVLVLLIVFMVTMPAIVIATAPIKVDVPETGAVAVSVESLPIIVSIRNEAGDLAIYVGEDRITEDSLQEALENKRDPEKDQAVSVSADRGLDYGDVVRVLDLVAKAGFHKVALDTKHAGG